MRPHLVLATCLILAAGSASAETSFLYDSHGGTATIISPGPSRWPDWSR